MSLLNDISQSITDFLAPANDFVNDILDVYIWYIAFVMLIAAALLFLWKYASIAWKDWKRQKAEGIKEPVFEADKVDHEGLDFSGITEWCSKA